MFVEVDDKSGFCFGVVNAISKAEKCIGEGGGLVSLGDIVHNGAEMARLAALGLEVVPENTDMASLAGRTVLIRAHGEPPATYAAAREHGITLIDATCPVVAALQRTAIEAHRKVEPEKGQVVIFGRRGHAEVRGLVGQIEHVRPAKGVAVIESEADLDTLNFNRPIYFLAQTTSSLSKFERLGEEIRRRAGDPRKVVVHDTVCRRVSGREEHLAEFARRHGVVIFVAGAKSSNGRVLFEAVRAANPHCYKIEGPAELHHEWFCGCKSAGICGATSTPKWLMEQVAEVISNYDSSR